MILFLKIILVVILFLAIELLAYKITEVWYEKIFNKVPFLNHRPWNCRLCLQFWLNVFCAVIFLLIAKSYTPTIIWLVLAVLETAALKIEENNKYIDDDNEDYGQY